MSLEAKAIVGKAGAALGKALKLDQFDSDGNMRVVVGEMKPTVTINDVTGAMERIYSLVKEFEVEVKIPLDQNPGYDMAPDPADPRRLIKKHWAPIPNEEKGIAVLVAAVRETAVEYERLKAEHEAKKAAVEVDNAPQRRRGRPPKINPQAEAPTTGEAA